MLKRLRPGNGETIEVKVKGLELPLLLRRSARARRFSLQVSEARRGAMLTMPVYSSFGDADEFLSRHLDWLKERVAGLSEPVPFTHGAIVPLRGLRICSALPGRCGSRGVVWVEAARRYQSRSCLAARRATADPQAAAPLSSPESPSTRRGACSTG